MSFIAEDEFLRTRSQSNLVYAYWLLYHLNFTWRYHISIPWHHRELMFKFFNFISIIAARSTYAAAQAYYKQKGDHSRQSRYALLPFLSFTLLYLYFSAFALYFRLAPATSISATTVPSLLSLSLRADFCYQKG